MFSGYEALRNIVTIGVMHPDDSFAALYMKHNSSRQSLVRFYHGWRQVPLRGLIYAGYLHVTRASQLPRSVL